MNKQIEPTNENQILDFFKALGDADRLKILGLLSNEALTITQISNRTELNPTEINKHLIQLQEQGLILQEGSNYRASSNAVEQKARAVLAQSRPKADPDRFQGDAYERKVLNGYCNRDGSLKDIPTKEKKLLVILKYLLPNFEIGKHYPEQEVNEIFLKYHEDYASLRRYMVEYGLMDRDKGIYWVVTPD